MTRRVPTPLLALAAMAALVACNSDTGIGPPPVTGPPSQLSIATAPSAAAQSGSALAVQPVVRLRDASARLVSQAGTVVTATTTTPGVTITNGTATTDANGAAHFSGLTLTGTVGSYTLRFTSGSLTPANATPLALAAGPAALLGLTAQPSAAGTAGVALTQQPAIQLRDASGNPAAVAGVTVIATLVSGSVALSSATATSSASGVAVFSGLTLAGTVGSYTLRFTSAGLGHVDATAATVLSAGAATQLALTTQPSAAASSGASLATQPSVQLRDAFGNDVALAGVKVAATLIAPAPGMTLINDTAVTSAAGKASYAALQVSGAVGTYTLRFSAAGYTSAVASSALTLAAGPAARLALTVQPSANTPNAVALTSQPVAQVQDSAGNPVARSGLVVTASVVSGNPTLTNATATTDATGKATFTGFTLTTTTGSYQLVFTAPTLSPVNAAFATFVSPGAASHLSVFNQGSTSATSGAPLAQQPIILLQDVSQNNVSQAGVVVTVTVFSGGNPVIANGTSSTNASGQALFSLLTFTGAGTYQIRFSAPGLTSVDAPNSLVIN
jgi:hypothetical protein